MKKAVFILALFFLADNSYAQKQTINWYFGYHTGLNFATNPPSPILVNPMDHQEGCSTISDTAGNLMFYTDGVTIWDKNNNPMLNGTGLYGNYTSTNSAIIVQAPQNDSLFYVFTIDYHGSPNGFNYSIVNIKRNSGLGEVIQKNVPIISGNIFEKQAVALHCNKKDVWIVVHVFNTNKYYSYLLTNAGLQTTPVVSQVGTIISGSFFNSLGYLKFSPNGKKMAAAYSGEMDFVEVFDFNNQTGQASNAIKLNARPTGVNSSFDIESGCYGVEFSPNSSLLYVTSSYELHGGKSNLFQFNLAAGGQSAIQSSRTTINSLTYEYFGGLQLGPDSKLYVTRCYAPTISVIHSPNILGTACNYQRDWVSLGDSVLHNVRLGLPYFMPSSVLPQFSYNFSTTGNCISQNTSFTINASTGFDSVKWNFGDLPSGANNFSTLQSPSHLFSASGIFSVQLIIYKGACLGSDTITKSIWVGAVNNFLGNDTSICENDTLRLSITNNLTGVSYLWNTGSTSNSINVYQLGQYSVTISAGTCTYKDTINVIVNPKPPSFSLGNDSSICANKTITLSPTPSPPNCTFLWSTGSNANNITVSSGGNYWVKATNNFGCFKADSIVISITPLPVFSLGSDTSICDKDSLKLRIGVPNAFYTWNTGSTFDSIFVKQQGIYWGEAFKNGCFFRDSISVQIKPLPLFNLGKDTIYCKGSINTLQINTPIASNYLWQNGTTNSFFIVNQPGQYWASANAVNGCSFRDTITIGYQDYPQFTLGNDTILCKGKKLYLSVNIPNASYQWQDGTLINNYTVSTSGLYWCDVNLNGCLKRDTVLVNYKDGPVVFIGNDTTLCNQSSITLDAGNAGASYLWSNGSSQQSISVSQTGLYSVEVGLNNCYATDTIKIENSSTPSVYIKGSRQICDGQTILLMAIPSTSDIKFLWSNGGLSDTTQIVVEGKYSVSVSNKCGSASDSIIVEKGLCKLVVPNAFSPNGDGVNELFLPQNTDNTKLFYFTIYNRYGQLVFETKDKNKGWDGLNSNKPVPTGTYFWVITYTTNSNSTPHSIKGHVTLFR